MNDLSDEQVEELKYIANASLNDAKKSSNDDTVRQLVFTWLDRHWLVTYYRGIDNLVDDTWSNFISPIAHIMVSVIGEDAPVCTNVDTLRVQMNDGSVAILTEGEDGEYDDD